MVPAVSRSPAAAVRGAVWTLVVAAFLFGATAASVLFVGVWRHEASRASAADAEVQQVSQLVGETSAKLADVEVRLGRQRERVAKLRAAAKPVIAEAGAVGAASQQLAAESAALADQAAKLTSAVTALNDYLKGTSLVQLDPAHVDGQLASIEQSVAAIHARASKLTSGTQQLAATRAKLERRAEALAKLAK